MVEKVKNSPKFWDATVETAFTSGQTADLDCILQIRAEAQGLAQWMEREKIQSYLELGIWTGGLLRFLSLNTSAHRFAACDFGEAKQYGLDINLPPSTAYFEGNSLSPIFPQWVKQQGVFDLVLIDTDHTYEAASRNFELHRTLGAKHIAFVGIAPNVRGETGHAEFWNDLEGDKLEILFPHEEIGLSDSTIGIGIWSAPTPTLRPKKPKATLEE